MTVFKTGLDTKMPVFTVFMSKCLKITKKPCKSSHKSAYHFIFNKKHENCRFLVTFRHILIYLRILAFWHIVVKDTAKTAVLHKY